MSLHLLEQIDSLATRLYKTAKPTKLSSSLSAWNFWSPEQKPWVTLKPRPYAHNAPFMQFDSAWLDLGFLKAQI